MRLGAALLDTSMVAVAMLVCIAPATATDKDIRTQVEADWARQEAQNHRSLASRQAVQDVLRRGEALADDLVRLGAAEPAARGRHVLEEIRRKLAAAGAISKDDPALREWYLEARWAVREMALASPFLDFRELLFVRRHWPYYDHQCAHHVGEAQIPGAELCVLEGLRPDAGVKHLTAGKLAPGGIGRPDLSFDGRRVVFPYAAPRSKPTPYKLYHNDYTSPLWDYHSGACKMFDIYEIGVDGTGLRQLTNVPDAENTEPCYLADGRIAFTSSRAGLMVQCGDWAVVNGTYLMDADGSNHAPDHRDERGRVLSKRLGRRAHYL